MGEPNTRVVDLPQIKNRISYSSRIHSDYPYTIGQHTGISFRELLRSSRNDEFRVQYLVVITQSKLEQSLRLGVRITVVMT